VSKQKVRGLRYSPALATWHLAPRSSSSESLKLEMPLYYTGPKLLLSLKDAFGSFQSRYEPWTCGMHARLPHNAAFLPPPCHQQLTLPQLCPYHAIACHCQLIKSATACHSLPSAVPQLAGPVTQLATARNCSKGKCKTLHSQTLCALPSCTCQQLARLTPHTCRKAPRCATAIGPGALSQLEAACNSSIPSSFMEVCKHVEQPSPCMTRRKTRMGPSAYSPDTY
jgi:hypothetical protein